MTDVPPTDDPSGSGPWGTPPPPDFGSAAPPPSVGGPSVTPDSFPVPGATSPDGRPLTPPLAPPPVPPYQQPAGTPPPGAFPPPAMGGPGVAPGPPNGNWAPSPVVYQQGVTGNSINTSAYGPLPEWPRRLLAKLIDVACLVIPLIVLNIVATGASGNWNPNTTSGFTAGDGAALAASLAAIAWPLLWSFVNDVVLTVKWGGSVGKHALSLRYVQTSGAKPDWGTGFKRWAIPAVCFVLMLCCVGYIALIVIAIINLVLIITDPAKQSLYDKVAGVIVIDGKINRQTSA